MKQRTTGRSAERLPPIDERIVMPETRWEVIDGEVVYVNPALPPHASRHSKLSALLEAYAAEGYDAASDMLTRTSEKGDMAPDGSIYPKAPDPVTGGRQLEELAFEVVSSESKALAGIKAARLVARGVRRVFAIDVERQRGLEWSIRTEGWEILPRDAVIEDRAFVLPLPVHDLVSAAKADDAVARALLAKRNPVLVEALAVARHEGKAEGKAVAILAVLEGRGLRPSPQERRTIAETRDPARLDAWLAEAGRCRDVKSLIAASKGRGGQRRS